MTRSREFASSPLRWGALGLIAIFVGGVARSADAQDPNHVLRHTDGSGTPGSLVELQLLTDNTGGNVDGWSFGVCLDPTQLEVVSVEPGVVVQGFNGGQGPFFSNIQILGDGWIAGLIVN